MSNLQLIEAVKLGDLAAIEELVRTDVDVNQQDEHGWTPLNWAAGKGDVAVVKLLLEKGADVLKVGRDLRTPYDIALAAGYVEVVELLRDAEDKADGVVSRPSREFCKAYTLSTIREFPGWTESLTETVEASAPANDTSETSNETDVVVFIHQDLTVTKSMWHNEDVIFDSVTPAWEQFCHEHLKFKVPDDLDYITAEQGSSN